MVDLVAPQDSMIFSYRIIMTTVVTNMMYLHLNAQN